MYLEEQWNEPSRTDYYLMQVAAFVEAVLKKKVQPLKKFRIPFKFKRTSITPKPKRLTPKDKKEQAKAAKARWFGFVGTTVKKMLGKK